ncbi:MAG: hypothetical protein ABSF45_15025 [Terriglobia bacterium]|jgi:hypothetical protein
MAAGWVHQTIDLVAYGRTYARVHREKDAASQITPGARHRAVGHEWYQGFGRDWDFTEPYPQAAKDLIERIGEIHGPDMAEEHMSSDSHDLIDRTWDGLSREERLGAEGYFASLVYHPDKLERVAGVDVIRGRIERVIDGRVVWEDSIETVAEYKSLRREVSRHQKWRLRDVLARYG